MSDCKSESSSSSRGSDSSASEDEGEKCKKKCDSDESDLSCRNGCRKKYGSCRCKKIVRRTERRRHDIDEAVFTSIVTPLSLLTPQYSDLKGAVEFRMRRKNKVVTLQWCPFTAVIAANGFAYLNVVQSICNLPPYCVNNCIFIRYNDVGRIVKMEVEPFCNNGNIRIYLNSDGSANSINVGDSVYVEGGSISWIVD